MVNGKLTVVVGMVTGFLITACGASADPLQTPIRELIPTSSPAMIVEPSETQAIFPTSSPIITAQPSASEAAPPTRVPLPTQPTIYPATATLSGPLIGSDRAYVSKLMAKFPAQLGGFDTAMETKGFDGVAVFILSNKDVSLTATIKFWYSGSEYNTFVGFAGQMPNGQVIQIGDGAKVDAQNTTYLAIMFYRNVDIWIAPPWNQFSAVPQPTTIPFTNDQLAAILRDIYEKILKTAP